MPSLFFLLVSFFLSHFKKYYRHWEHPIRLSQSGKEREEEEKKRQEMNPLKKDQKELCRMGQLIGGLLMKPR